MWWCAIILLYVVVTPGAQGEVVTREVRGDHDEVFPTSVDLSTVTPPNSSPLAQLIATATGSNKALVFPLTAKHRNKRKPLKFRSKGESRFRPNSFKKEQPKFVPPVKSSQGLDDKSLQKKSRFSGFPQRPRPAPVNQFLVGQKTEQEVEDKTYETTTETYLNTPQQAPVISQVIPSDPPREALKSRKPIPFVLSNDISVNSPFDQAALFERLQSLTGAQPVGVTTDIAHHVESKVKQEKKGDRDEYARQLSDNQDQVKSRSSSRRGAARRVVQENIEKEKYYEEVQKSKPVSRKTTFPQRHKKFKPGKKRYGKKATVGTVKNYRFENEDGSITWGYENDDGGFKEETIGIDCVTHGKYGYTDSNGEPREYSYTSGIRCDPHTKKVPTTDYTRGGTNHGFYDYTHNKFVMPDGRRVTVVVNQRNKARGRRY